LLFNIQYWTFQSGLLPMIQQHYTPILPLFPLQNGQDLGVRFAFYLPSIALGEGGRLFVAKIKKRLAKIIEGL
jgi:hypothetical protein